MDDEGHERQLNIHLDPEHLAGVYANFANVSSSEYEFTITFARVDHDPDEGRARVDHVRVELEPPHQRAVDRQMDRAINRHW